MNEQENELYEAIYTDLKVDAQGLKNERTRNHKLTQSTPKKELRPVGSMGNAKYKIR